MSAATTRVEIEPAAIRAWTEGRTTESCEAMREARVFIELTCGEPAGSTDDRIFGFPANRFKRLKAASDEELKQVEIQVNG